MFEFNSKPFIQVEILDFYDCKTPATKNNDCKVELNFLSDNFGEVKNIIKDNMVETQQKTNIMKQTINEPDTNQRDNNENTAIHPFWDNPPVDTLPTQSNTEITPINTVKSKGNTNFRNVAIY